MKRLLAIALSASLVVVLGCTGSYERRLEATLARMRYLQTLDQYLKAAEGGKLQQLGVYVRPPITLQATKNPTLNAPDGHYDINTSFLDTVPGGGAAEGKEKEKASGPPMRLHVLGRVTRKGPQAKKKGEPEPPQAIVPRGVFVEDVRSLLASDLGSDEALTAPLVPEKRGGNDYKRLVFTASNGNQVKVYFFKQAEYDLALILDVPPEQQKSITATTGANYMMEALAVGPRAIASFEGIDTGEMSQESGEGAASAGGQAF